MRRLSSTVVRIVVAAAASTSAACDQVDLERMLDQNKGEAYEQSPFFEDGRVMRHPPEGAVAREAAVATTPYNSGLNGDDYVTQVPLTVTMELLLRGEQRFRIFCQTCHGPLGDGVSHVAENMTLRRPPSLHEARVVSFAPGRLYRVVKDGYGLMPSYSSQLSVNDRWAVVAFVQALQLSQRAQLSTLPPSVRQEAESWLK